MNQQEIDTMAQALRSQGLTWAQTNFAVSLVRNNVDAERERMIAEGWRQTRYLAPVTDCEACLTPDACAIRGQCGHYLRERGLTTSSLDQEAPMTKQDAPPPPADAGPVQRAVGRQVPERKMMVNRWRVQCAPGSEPYFERHEEGPWAQREPLEAEVAVLTCQVNSLRAALVKVLEARKTEARASFSYVTAHDNFSAAGPESKRHLAAMTAASSAEKEARMLLTTLKTPNVVLSGREAVRSNGS